MALPIFQDIEQKEREELKQEIDKFPGGRAAFAEHCGEGYMTLSHRLNGKTSNRLQRCVADHYWQKLGKVPPVRG